MKKDGFLKRIIGGILSAIIGAIAGAVIFVYYGLHFWLPVQINNLSSGAGAVFGIITLIPVTIVIFAFFGIISGAILGLIIKFIWRKIRRK